jgi:hypothetical protein
MKRKTKRTIRALLPVLLFAEVEAEKFTMGDEPIRAKISLRHPNRLSVKKDRIASVSGLDQAFYWEKNEKTGDGFIRPTEANGRNPIALSVSTVSGRTQDLLLEPTDGNPNVLELINEDSPIVVPDTGNDNLSLSSGDCERGIVEAMKRAISGKNVVEAAENVPDRKRGVFQAKYEGCFFAKGYLCRKFLVTTEANGEFAPNEKDFVESGDVALSFSRLKIAKNRPAHLYVLRR